MNIVDVFEFVDALREHRRNVEEHYTWAAKESAKRLVASWKKLAALLVERGQLAELVGRTSIEKAEVSLCQLEGVRLEEGELQLVLELLEKRRRALADAIVAACFPIAVTCNPEEYEDAVPAVSPLASEPA
jgi:hypothetical protein